MKRRRDCFGNDRHRINREPFWGPPRNPPPSKDELRRQLAEAVRNTAAAANDKASP